MKKLIFASAALCAAATISAQEVVEVEPQAVQSTESTSKPYKTEAGRFGVEAAIDLKDGFSFKEKDFSEGEDFDGFKGGRITATYTLSDKLSLRCGFGLHVNKVYKHDDVTIKTEDEVNDKKYTTNSNTKSHTTKSEFEVVPGIVYSFKGTDRFEPYIGAEALLGFDKTRTNAKEVVDTNIPETIDYDLKSKETSTGVYFGANGFTGFNFFLCKDLFVGAELGFGFKVKPTDRNDRSKIEDSRIDDPEEEVENDDKHMGHTTDINMMFHPSIRLGWRF